MVAFAEEKALLPRISREDYLVWESQQEGRNEYHDGFVIEMSGASPEHNRINANIGGFLNAQLLDAECQEFVNEMRVYVPQCNGYFYPDTLVVCEEPEYEMIQGVASLLNPAALFEVLSRSTANSDRTDKFGCYKTLPSLQTYVLVTQDKPRIEVFERQATGEWTETIYAGLDATAKLERIGCELALKRVYARITFEQVETE